MSEEEKKAIEVLKEFKKTGFHTLGYKYNKDRRGTVKLIENTLEKILNLIEKQQAEIEDKNILIKYYEKLISNGFASQEITKLNNKLIQTARAEIEKKDKIIDEMAEVLNDFDYDKQCESCHTDICSASVDGTEYTKCIIEYFTKKVERE